MNVRSRLLVPLAAVLAVLGGAAVSPATATGGTDATCQAHIVVTITPGISSTPSSGTYGGRKGTLKCQPGSKIRGHAVGDARKFVVSGNYGTKSPGDDCQTGHGNGVGKAVFI